jgi:hypothetical protein
VLLVLRAYKAISELLVRQDLTALQDHKVHVDHKDLSEQLVHLDLSAQQDHKARVAHKDHKDPLEQQVRRG